jgi:hypothetical protein
MLLAVAATIEARKEDITTPTRPSATAITASGWRGFAAVTELLYAESFEDADGLFRKVG